MNKRKYKELLKLRQSQELMLFYIIKHGIRPLEAIKIAGIPDNRATYILYKWTHKGFYDYGVNVCFGWLEVDELPIHEITMP